MMIEDLEQILGPRPAVSSGDAAEWCLFDEEWYLAAYPAVREEVAEPTFEALRAHYIATGRARCYSPNMFFDEAWYRRRYPDIPDAIAMGDFGSGYEHYCTLGHPNRSAHWLFDDMVYRQESPDLTDAELIRGGCFNRYDHYLKAGAREGRIAHLLFQPAVYRDSCGDPAGVAAIGAFRHFLRRLWFERAETPTSRYFDPVWYLATHAEAREAVAERRFAGALHHYLTADTPALRDPLAQFSEAFYRENNTDAAAAIASGEFFSGYDHFLKFGVFEERAPSASLDLGDYLARTPTARRAVALGLARDFFTYALAPVAVPVDPPPPPPPEPAAPTAPERPAYTGENTLGRLRDRVFLEVDEVIFCPPDGLLMIGWMLASAGVIKSVRLCCGERWAEIRLADLLRVPRPDVTNDVARHYGLQDRHPGYLAFVGEIYDPTASCHIELETQRGEIAHRGIPAPRLEGMAAIRSILERFDLRYSALVQGFDHVVGPAVSRLNRERLASATGREVVDFGRQADAPLLSVIVPLYGRLDFMEYQLALFSAHDPELEYELIYVLDDPDRQREAELLAASVFARFALPFRLVLLERNVGYAPANNIGLELARGDHVCFLNSDVFPQTPDWMARLVDRLLLDSGLGAVGPLLLFEDGGVQHQGMAFEALPEFGGWMFPLHPRKGWRPPTGDGEGEGVLAAPAITGACLVVARDVVRELGGLDESFVIGDFEDADLCMKLAARGLRCGVDLETRMYHLERQSQAGSEQRWRMNLTLYNAWVHERRWGERLRESAELPA